MVLEVLQPKLIAHAKKSPSQLRLSIGFNQTKALIFRKRGQGHHFFEIIFKMGFSNPTY